MALVDRVLAFATQVGTDIKQIVANIGSLTGLTTVKKTSLVDAINELVNNGGSLNNLTTTDRTSLVNAINEVTTRLNAAGTAVGINDSTTTNTSVWSSSKTSDTITTQLNQLKSDLMGGAASTALDTLTELGNALNNDPNFATTIVTSMNKRVAVDVVQTFTTAEKLQGCNNIGVGDPDTDFVATYTTAKS